MKGPGIPGARYHLLTLIERVNQIGAAKEASYRFRCDCGGERVCRLTDVRQGRAVSCGCVRPAQLLKKGEPPSAPQAHNESPLVRARFVNPRDMRASR